jgi:DNA invertase Pin-like site-specific DNA recombinase
MTHFVAFYRVSADRQGASGLGLDAQRQAVGRHLAGKGDLAAEYTEIESGRRDANRPQLHAALAECRASYRPPRPPGAQCKGSAFWDIVHRQS